LNNQICSESDEVNRARHGSTFNDENLEVEPKCYFTYLPLLGIDCDSTIIRVNNKMF